MKDLVLPLDLKVETRGVDRLGNGTALDVNVIVEGVLVVKVGEGGKTNNVCKGVEAAEVDSTTPTDALRKTLLRRSGGSTGQRDSARRRVDGIVTCEMGVTASSTTSGFGEDGTGGRILRLMGRFFCLGKRVGS